jgi:two-component system cell cycle sensor histidine kinase PleC
MQPVKQPELESHSLTDDPGNDNGSSMADLQRRNAALEERIRKLQQVVDYRSTLLARLAHELRTPLTSILGFSEILLEHEKLTKAQRGFCERIQNAAHQLQCNLNQLLDLSRLESGQSSLRPEEFSLDDLLREACAEVTRQAEKQNAELRCHCEAALPMIVSDRARLRQVVANFLAYAITRSPDAIVLVTAEKRPAGFSLKIEDDGEVPADCQPFLELDPSHRRAGSSELGMAIARQNLGLLGASLSFQNREPRGLQVMIELPAAPPEATQS